MKNQLTKEQYRITQQGGTEAPFSGKYYNHKETGDYLCVCCDKVLFQSGTKFNSGTGWPSFDASIPNSIEYLEDNNHGMKRVEVRCANCSAHLGHIFDDGMTETGQRYCINSVALSFKKKNT